MLDIHVCTQEPNPCTRERERERDTHTHTQSRSERDRDRERKWEKERESKSQHTRFVAAVPTALNSFTMQTATHHVDSLISSASHALPTAHSLCWHSASTCSDHFYRQLTPLYRISPSSSSAFPSQILGVHHVWWDFSIRDHFLIQPLR